ncbi:MAG: bifunctional nuclease family protein [Abditibacteriales bacterium]|nr:bifunctional nuclease family protein [Abditibacteriales bacterium]
MVVEGIGLDQNQRPLVLLRDLRKRLFIPIWIGQAEAHSIQMELESRQPLRPMTHDLMNNILKELGVKLRKVTVNDCRDSIYYATLTLQVEDSIQEVDARPSDAIALALRANAAIFVSEKVAMEMGITLEEGQLESDLLPGKASPQEIEQFEKLIEGVDLSAIDKDD